MVEKKIAKANTFTLGAIFRLVSNRGNLEMCEEIFEQLREQKAYSLFSFSHYVNACIKRNNLEKALTLILEMKRNNIEPNYATFISMLKAATSLKNQPVGVKILELIDYSKTTQVQVLFSVIKFALQAKIPEKVIEVCEELKKKRLMNVISWTCLIQAHIQMNDTERAIQLLDEMKKCEIKPDSTTFTILITACANKKMLEHGKYLHNLALKEAVKFNVELATSIVNFYTKCNQPERAIEECKTLKQHNLMNTISWNCFMQAHIEMNETDNAVNLLDEMKQNNSEPDSKTFIILISACAKNKLLDLGMNLHQLALKLDKVPTDLWNCILNMYTKCKEPVIVIGMCEKLKDQKVMNVVSWTCLIQAYLLMNEIDKAVQLLEEMEMNGISPDETIFNILITACSNNKVLEQGIYLHNLALRVLGNLSVELTLALLRFYNKCKRPETVIEECERLREKGLMDTVSWNYFIQAHIQMKEIDKAIQFLTEMDKGGTKPNTITFTILITACAKHNLIEKGKHVHNYASKVLGIFNVELATSIVNFYTKCNQPEKAIELCEQFKKQKLMNVITYNCFMQAHIQMKEPDKGVKLLDEMADTGIQPDATTFIILITACANNREYAKGKDLHVLAENLDNIPTDLWNSILSFYAKCDHPEIVIEMCQKLKHQTVMNVISYTCLMQAYIQMNDIERGIQLLDEMAENDIEPDLATFKVLIAACSNNNMVETGKYLHKLVLTKLTLNEELVTSIISMYMRCNLPEIVIEECEKLDPKLLNIFSWNCFIQANVQVNEFDKAVKLLTKMEKNGISPDSNTFTILITACTNNKLLEKGKYLHNQALGMLNSFTISLSTAIVNFYTKCNQPEKAIEECKLMREKGLMDVVSWNCLINAHIQSNDICSAFYSYQQMKIENLEPDIITYTSLLSGCGDFMCQEKGLSIIQEIHNRGLDSVEEIISSKINFYSKVGEKSQVTKLISTLQKKNSGLSIITYNNVLSHYARHGNGIEAIKLFDEMIKNDVEPNDQTFTIMLNAFSNCGMVAEAEKLFIKIKNNRIPCEFHIGAMIDVYSRAGLLEQAEELIGNEMNFIWWNTVMSGCRKFNNIQVGERAFTKLTSIQPQESSPFLFMSQIYTYHGLNEKAEMIRKLMEKNGIRKIPGIVCYEENEKSYKFISGATDFERYEEVEKMRNEIYRKIIKAGFKPDTKWVSNVKPLTEQEKEASLSKHAEKTAIAHALVLNPKRKNILLTCNLRVCNDCHNAIEFISKIFKLEIIVKDPNRYHHFVNGKCSCNNYW